MNTTTPVGGESGQAEEPVQLVLLLEGKQVLIQDYSGDLMWAEVHGEGAFVMEAPVEDMLWQLVEKVTKLNLELAELRANQLPPRDPLSTY